MFIGEDAGPRESAPAAEGELSQPCLWICWMATGLTLDVHLVEGSLKVKDSLGIGQVGILETIK